MADQKNFRSRQKVSKHQRNEHGQEGDSSLSSLGSLPEVQSVASHFGNDSPSRARITTHNVGSSAQHQTLSRASDSRKIDKRPRRTCPHCRKSFSNAWSVSKHIEVRNISVLASKLVETTERIEHFNICIEKSHDFELTSASP